MDKQPIATIYGSVLEKIQAIKESQIPFLVDESINDEIIKSALDLFSGECNVIESGIKDKNGIVIERISFDYTDVDYFIVATNTKEETDNYNDMLDNNAIEQLARFLATQVDKRYNKIINSK